MTYNKPEVTVLGSAVRVIQGSKNQSTGDSPFQLPNPAYELDEE